MIVVSSMRDFLKRGINYLRRRYGELCEITDYIFHQNAFVFGAPYHSNAGDQAQTFCIEKWINKNYPKHKVRIFTTDSLTWNDYKQLKTIKKIIKKTDMLFLHSGYHTTDLYMLEENMQRKVVELFHNKQIVILPQTIFYKSLNEEKEAIRIYNSHPNLLMMCRDDVSYSIAERIFTDCKRILFPDIVTTLIGTKRYDNSRRGILLCVRNDQEALLKERERKRLQEELSEIDTVELTDTTLPIDGTEFCKNREQILEKVWSEYAKYRVIITDRYHGTIFSLIAGTPVIVIPSTDHKLESGVRWFPDSFGDYVQYVNEFSNIIDAVRAVYQTKFDYKLPNYFNKEYYSNLKKIIEEKNETM